jgi:hypothetical protein
MMEVWGFSETSEPIYRTTWRQIVAFEMYFFKTFCTFLHSCDFLCSETCVFIWKLFRSNWIECGSVFALSLFVCTTSGIMPGINELWTSIREWRATWRGSGWGLSPRIRPPVCHSVAAYQTCGVCCIASPFCRYPHKYCQVRRKLNTAWVLSWWNRAFAVRDEAIRTMKYHARNHPVFRLVCHRVWNMLWATKFQLLLCNSTSQIDIHLGPRQSCSNLFSLYAVFIFSFTLNAVVGRSPNREWFQVRYRRLKGMFSPKCLLNRFHAFRCDTFQRDTYWQCLPGHSSSQRRREMHAEFWH